MKSEKKKSGLGSSMELIRGGVEASASMADSRKCICSPGGWSYGNLDCGCACGCFTTGDAVNMNANNKLANPECIM